MKRKRYRPHRVDSNPLALAMARIGKLDVDQVKALTQPVREALDAIGDGSGHMEAWSTLADAFNVAEALAGLRIASNLTDRIDDAQCSLAQLLDRVRAGEAWTLRGLEHATIRQGVWLYGLQLSFCSAGEYQQALTNVHRRISQALAGNASPRTRMHVAPVVHQP